MLLRAENRGFYFVWLEFIAICNIIDDLFSTVTLIFVSETNAQCNTTPKRNIAKPGEIREYYQAQLLSFQNEIKQKDEESLRLSEALIMMIEVRNLQSGTIISSSFIFKQNLLF